MEAKAREERNAYMRVWRAKNRDKVKAIQERYWENKSKKMKNEGEKTLC